MANAAFQPRLKLTSFVIIPARMASTRLPRKMLLAETGKTLIQHTYEAASRAARPLGVCVATDDEEIRSVVQSFGGQVEMTDVDLASGTDRVAQLARRMPDMDIVVNVQGDEPELCGSSIDLVVRLLEERPDMQMSTLATPIRTRAQLEDPAAVKVVFAPDGRALYFSRSPIPHARQWDECLLTAQPATFYLHVGIYAYRRDALLRLTSMNVSRLEQLEKLEQLRALEAGMGIVVGLIDDPTCGIDTPADYQAFVQRYRSR